MQAQCTYGVSRGCLKTGVAIGRNMIEFCPWGKYPFQASPNLKSLVKSWAGQDAIFLSPTDWYLRGRDLNGGHYNERKFWIPKMKAGTYIWAPPPAAAAPCLDKLKKARIKGKKSRHIVIIQWRMTPTWLRQLIKAADCIFTVPASHPFWPSTNYEPVYVAILFSYINHRPFQLRGTPKMFEMGRRMSKLFQDVEVDRGDILFKCLQGIRRLPSMSECMVWQLLYLRG